MQEFLNQLAEVAFGMSIKKAHEQGVCVVCKKEVNIAEMDNLDRREYRISGLCSPCFEDMAKEE